MLKVIANPLRQGRFWILLLALTLILFGVPFLPQGQKQEMARQWQQNRLAFVTEMNKYVPDQLNSLHAATTEPSTSNSGSIAEFAARIIDNQLSDDTGEQFWDYIHRGEWRKLSIAAIRPAMAGAIISWVFCFVVPPPRNAQDVRQFSATFRSLSPGRTVSDQDSEALKSGIDALIRARQLRVAVRYALASGAITVLVPPIGTGLAPWLSSTLHLPLIFGACICFAIWGVLAFSNADKSMAWIAWRIGFGGIFIAGLIALSISLPYQLMNPTTAVLWQRQTIGTILLVRLIACPGLGFFSGLAMLFAHNKLQPITAL